MWCIAHRGGAALRPENTLAAFRDAVARGCDGAELDVQLSRDGEVVVFHDYRLKPEICRDEHGAWLVRPTPRIKDLTLEELRRFDIGRADPASAYARATSAAERGRWRAHSDAGAGDRSGEDCTKPFQLFVELKTSFADRNLSADPRELAEATLHVLRAHDYVDRTILVGFDWPGLLHAKALEPQVECWFSTQPQSWFRDAAPPAEDEPPSVPALQMLRHWAASGTSPWAGGYDAVNYGGSILPAIRTAGGDGWFPMYRDATPDAVAEARALGLKVGAWTVDEPADMRMLADLGLDAICTDRPDLLLPLASGP